MPNVLRIILAAIIIMGFSGNAFSYDLAKNVTEFRLPNGMKWLLVRRTQAPVFSGVVMLKVGGADEVEGKTGLAHMFEHMAFKGTGNIGTRSYKEEKPILDEIEKTGEELAAEQKKQKPDPNLIQELGKKMAALQKRADAYQIKNEIWEVMSRNGAADLNAFTSKDVTSYHSSLPINRLGLWAKVTSEMIFNPVYREFYTERSVVAEERRSGVDNNPDGMMGEKILSSAYVNGPYHWSTIGFEKDVMGLTIKDARAFHDKYYVPANMVGVLVGDIDIGSAKKVIQENFGGFEKKPAPQGPQKAGDYRANTVEKMSFDAEPSLAISWHKPTLPDPAEYVFDVIDALLCVGNSSRLSRRLVYEKKMAQGVYCTVAYPGSRLNNLFLIWIEPLKSVSVAAVLKEVEAEIEKLKNELVREDELTRVRKNVTSSLVFALEDNMNLAQELARFETIFGNWRLLADYPRKIKEIDAVRVMETAKKYLTDSNRVVVERSKTK